MRLTQLWMEYAAAACIGFLIDFIVGDPQGLWHPVCGIGSLISRMEKQLRRNVADTPQNLLLAGAALAVTIPCMTVVITAVLLLAAGFLHPYLRFALMCVLDGWILAARSLKTESMKVYRKLKEKDLNGARYAVSMIVGRDTERLTAEGVTRAAVETVAENASDGVIAPLLFLFFFGPVGGFFYKAVNTMDSMVGYKNEKYLYFGRAAAKLDDLVNYIPARLTGLAFAAAACLIPGMSGKNAFKIWRRDRRNHKSPNSAQSESACAGALGVQLAGDAWYFGELYHKPTIGDALRPIEPEDIPRANRLMYVASVLTLAVCAAAKLDDLVNYIPARLTGLAFAAAACLIPGMSGKNAFKIWRRDRRNHKSPNSAQSESACAGALGVQLAGDAWYFGELYHKPTIGDALRPIEPEDIPRANRLMYVASVLTLAVCAAAVAFICCMFAPGGMGL